MNFQCVKGTFSRCYGVVCVLLTYDFHYLVPFSRLSHLHLVSSPLLSSPLLSSSLLFSSLSLPLSRFCLCSCRFFSVLCCRCFCCCVAVAGCCCVACCCCVAVVCLCCGCFSFRGIFSLFLLIFFVTQAVAEQLSGAFCAARRVHVSW